MTNHSRPVFHLGDVVRLKGEGSDSLAVIVGGSFMGPPSFLGVLHVYSNNQVVAVTLDDIDGIRFRGDGREVEFR